MDPRRLTRLMLIGCRPDTLKCDAHTLCNEARDKRDQSRAGEATYQYWNNIVRYYLAEIKYLANLNT
jgi:hypothetical protein